MDGDTQIKLTKSDSSDGQHHFLPVHLVERVDDKVHLSIAADEAAGHIH
jgi:hypothetical protein